MTHSPFDWARARDAGLAFRPITDADLPFLARVYASTRQAELAVTDWSEAQKAAFLQHQFDAQHAHYQKYYQGSDFLVIERAGAAIGRLYLARWASEHRIVDIALLPQFQRRGAGTLLLRELMQEAESAGKFLRHMVFVLNDNAHRFYERLGFVVIEDVGGYKHMEFRAKNSEK